MKKGVYFLSVAISVVVCSLFSLPSAYSEDQKSPTESYIDELHNQGKERVIVSFKDDAVVDTSLVDKYGGKLIYIFTTIKALICEIPQENIELLKNEESIKNVFPDLVMQAQPSNKIYDPQWLAEFLRLKEEYLNRVKQEYRLAQQAARQEFLRFIKEELSKKHRLLESYVTALNYYRIRHLTNSPKYRSLLAEYHKKLREYYDALKNALAAYHEKLRAAKDIYATASGAWKEKVNEMMILSYSGPAIVRWNNQEAGLNSQAAWDRYNLDGAGIKIAILDTGIDYMRENLGGGIGSNFKCLGGYDCVDKDDNPINKTLLEAHGTEVAELAVGQGVNELEVIGVAYHTSYYAVRVMQGEDVPTGLLGDVMAGIEWASTKPHKADIISMSLGFYDEDYPPGHPSYPWWQAAKDEFKRICNNAYNAGIVLVAGSGNRYYDHSGYPAAFANVISVGAHGEDQTQFYYDPPNPPVLFSNGGVDIIAPGIDVRVVDPDNSAYLVTGTSFAAPHAAGLIALQLQYARQHKLDLNNGYNWEVMNHSAKDLGLNPTYQGYGKIWAAETNPPPPTPHKGAIDLLTSSIWPFEFTFNYIDYIYLDQGKYPAYFIGTDMVQDITITNITNRPGYTPLYIEQMNVTTIQKYLDTNEVMPEASTEDFQSYEPITLDPGGNIVLHDSYYMPWETIPGLDKVVLDLEFKLAGNPRLLKITNNEASIWCPPPAINEGFPVQN